MKAIEMWQVEMIHTMEMFVCCRKHRDLSQHTGLPLKTVKQGRKGDQSFIFICKKFNERCFYLIIQRGVLEI